MFSKYMFGIGCFIDQMYDFSTFSFFESFHKVCLDSLLSVVFMFYCIGLMKPVYMQFYKTKHYNAE